MAHLLTSSAQFGLIACAFVMTEVLELSGSAVLAVAVSVGLQQFYGMAGTLDRVLSGAAASLLYCLFYWRTRRATPLVVGSFFSKLWILLHQVGGRQ